MTPLLYNTGFAKVHNEKTKQMQQKNKTRQKKAASCVSPKLCDFTFSLFDFYVLRFGDKDIILNITQKSRFEAPHLHI